MNIMQNKMFPIPTNNVFFNYNKITDIVPFFKYLISLKFELEEYKKKSYICIYNVSIFRVLECYY